MQEIDNIIQMKKDVLAKCPWHKEVKLRPLLDFFVEEVEELKQAHKNQDLKNLKEETGDCFWTLISFAMHCEKEGLFTLKDCLGENHKKIKNRLKHVYGDEVAHTPEDAVRIWIEAKKEEEKK